MTATIQSLSERARAGLESAAARVKALGAGAWRFSLEPGAPMRGSATADEGWLLMRVAFGAGRSEATLASPERLWALLERNGKLSGGTKFVLDPADRVQVRAEIPLDADDEGDDPAELIEEACRGFREAVSGVSARGGPTDPAGGRGGGDLSALLDAAGWPHTARSNGNLAVSLDVPHGFYRALVRSNAERSASFSVDLCPGRRLTPKGREALAVLLLRSSAVVRMVRAAAGEEAGVPAVRFEVVLGGCVNAAQAGHALSALSVGCRLCGAECGILAGDDHLAEQFLAIRGGPRRAPGWLVKSEGGRTMAKEETLRINAQDVSGQKAAVVEGITQDVTVAELMQTVLAQMELPANDPSGRPLTYHARLERRGEHLNADEKVGEAGLQNDDMIVLQPNVDAGR